MANENSNNRIRWNEANSEDFIDYGNYFVPDREEQIETICSIISIPSEPCHILDLCCGEGLLSHALLDRFPKGRVHGFDGSSKMVKCAKKLLSNYGERFDVYLFDLADTEWRKLLWPVHAVVSSLAIHHLDGDEKKKLFKDIIHSLVPNGSFIIADIIQPTTQLGVELAAKAWDETVRQRSLDLDGNLEAYEYFQEEGWNFYSDPELDPIDKPSSLFDQLKWLEEAGFVNIDVFWMKAGHAIFGGYKPAI